MFLTYPIPAFSLRWFDQLATDDAWRSSIVNSLIVGSGTTLLADTLGTLASLGLRHRGVVLPGLLRTVFLVPMVVPAVTLGVGMQICYVRLGVANTY